jgi:F0F1-type ATP synthase membrane subunit b/b'
MLPSIRDQIAGLRAEAKRMREHAKYARMRYRAARDPMERFHARCRVSEYVSEAQKRDRAAAELRLQLGPRRPRKGTTA